MIESNLNNKDAKVRVTKFDDSILPDLNKPRFDDRLPILYSCRVRLNDDQRSKLKLAWNQYRKDQTPTPVKPMPGSTVKSTAAFQPQALADMNAFVISDMITTRDSVPLVTILNLSEALGVDVISKEDLHKAFDGYLTYVFSEAKRKYGK